MNRMFFALALARCFLCAKLAHLVCLVGVPQTTIPTQGTSRHSIFRNSASRSQRTMASIGRIGHFEGNPYKYEGVGMGSTPDTSNTKLYVIRQIQYSGSRCFARIKWYVVCLQPATEIQKNL
jgi:hypothetical protein